MASLTPTLGEGYAEYSQGRTRHSYLGSQLYPGDPQRAQKAPTPGGPSEGSFQRVKRRARADEMEPTLTPTPYVKLQGGTVVRPCFKE